MSDSVLVPASRPPELRRMLPAFSAVALVITVTVALAIGSGLGRSSPRTLAARATALESTIRCPSCEDISVAQSDSSAALAARHLIAAMLRHGKSDSEIDQSFVQRYGPSILLDPPTSGWGILVWILPVLGALGALSALFVVFWRRARALRRLRAP